MKNPDLPISKSSTFSNRLAQACPAINISGLDAQTALSTVAQTNQTVGSDPVSKSKGA